MIGLCDSKLIGTTMDKGYKDVLCDKSSVKKEIPAELNHLRDLLYQWIEDTGTAIKELYDLADNLDIHFSRISKVKVGGSAAAVGGGILAAVGFGLSFVTFGASLGLTIAGGIIAGVGGTTASGSMIANAVISKQKRKSTEEILKRYNAELEKLRSECGEISEHLGKYGNMDECFSEWVRFWAKLVLDAASCTKQVGWDIVARNILTGLRFVTYADDAARLGAQTAATAFRTLGTAGQALHVVGGVAGILFMPLDIYTLVDSAIDVHKKNPNKVSKGIREAAKRLAEDVPTKESVNSMLDKTTQMYKIRRQTMFDME